MLVLLYFQEHDHIHPDEQLFQPTMTQFEKAYVLYISLCYMYIYACNIIVVYISINMVDIHCIVSWYGPAESYSHSIHIKTTITRTSSLTSQFGILTYLGYPAKRALPAHVYALQIGPLWQDALDMCMEFYAPNVIKCWNYNITHITRWFFSPYDLEIQSLPCHDKTKRYKS